MSTKTPEQLAEERIPWDRATTDAVGLPYDGVHNTRDIARAAYATAIREEVEPRDRLLQELVDYACHDEMCELIVYAGRGTGNPENVIARPCTCGLSAILAKAKEQFGITPKP